MNVATIFAGGTGQRMKTAACPKQFLKLYGKPIIIYTLEVFQQHPAIDHIIVACVSGWEDRLEKMCTDYGITKLYKIVQGGKDTQESKLNALYGLADLCQDDDIVLMHDAVRPMITAQLISIISKRSKIWFCHYSRSVYRDRRCQYRWRDGGKYH